MPLLGIRTLVTAALSAIVTGLVLAAVLIFVRGDDNAPIQVLLPTPEISEGTASTNSGGTADAGPGEDLRVYVSGAVQNPGVYRLGPDHRVADALSAAGGATTDANLDAVNLAERVKDEEHYHIPRVGETPPPGASLAAELDSTTEASCGGLMDLNVASAAQLDTLPGIGAVRANDIVAYRKEHGHFASVEQITEISGIGPATLEKIRDLVAVCNG